MIRIVGSLMLIASLSGIGMILSSDLRRRPMYLLQLVQALELLQDDLACHQLPLPDAFAHTGGMSQGIGRHLFLSVSYKLGQDDRRFSALWEDELEAAACLKREDLDALLQLGRHLGQIDAASQKSAIQTCVKRLEQLRSDALDYSRQYCRLYTGIGMTLGCMLAVMLY